MERLRPDDPEQIGPWQIINRLGAGGMGIVYMGTNGTHAAAVKIVREFLLEDPAAKARLNREVTILKRVKSKYVAEIVGSDIDAKPAWIATNYVDGPSLKTLIENQGPLRGREWFDLARGLMSALASIHAAGVVHRDIKPSNILLSNTGPRLIDFGISFSSEATSLTRTGMVAGTPAWFAPEQFETGKITPTVDNFAAGSVLYFAATGKNPWGKEDTSVANTMHSILNKEADYSDLTEDQRLIISLLHKKSPKERSTAEEILARIDAIDSSSNLRVTHSRRGSKAKILSLLALMSVMAAGVGGYLLTRSTQEKPIDQIESVAVIPTWDVKIVGDPQRIQGSGNTYSLFLCDQGVINRSLTLRELTVPAAPNQPNVELFPRDERCGEDFDTIYIEGSLDDTKKRRSYLLGGTTSTGFVIQYEFTISRTN